LPFQILVIRPQLEHETPQGCRQLKCDFSERNGATPFVRLDVELPTAATRLLADIHITIDVYEDSPVQDLL
jgi:hypothetical protein